MQPARTTGKAAAWLAAIVLLGGALRFGWAVSQYRIYLPHVSSERDEGYHDAAVSLLAWKTVSYTIAQPNPWPFRGPLYPGFIAAVEAPFSTPWPGRVRIAQAGLSTLAIPAVYALAEAAFSPAAGLWAAALCAADPNQIADVSSTNIECFYGICILAVALCACRWCGKPGLGWLAAAALTTAASLMARSAHFLLPGLLAAGLAAAGGRREGLRSAATFALLLVLFLLPWAARNSALFGRWLPEDVEAGSFRLFSASIGETKCCDEPVQLAEAAALDPSLAPRLAGSGRYAALRELALRNIASHPFRYARTVAANALDFYGPLLPALFLGLLALRRRPGLGLASVLLVFLSFAGNALIVIGNGHRDALFPVACALAGAGLAALLAGDGPELGRAAWASKAAAALAAVPCLCWAVTGGFLAAETARYAGVRDRGSEYQPADGRALRLLDQAAAHSQGRYGLLERAQLLHRAGRNPESCAAYGRAARTADSSGRCFAMVGLFRCSLEKGDLDGALARLEERTAACGSGDREPLLLEAAEALAAKAWSEAGAGRKAQAARDLARSIELMPRTHGAKLASRLAYRATLLLELGRAREGKAELARALAVHPDAACDPSSLPMDPSLLSEAFFDACSDRSRKTAKWLHDRGVARYRRGDRAGALADFERAEKADPALVEARLSRSTLLLERGRLAEALEESLEARRLSAGRPTERQAAEGLEQAIRKELQRRPGAAPGT